MGAEEFADLVAVGYLWQTRCHETQANSYYGYHYPAEIISHAAWFYGRFILSYRDIAGLLAERAIIVSYGTIRQWCLKF